MADIKRNQVLLLQIILLDLIGFSLIFPLVPQLLSYYIDNASGIDAYLPALASSLESFLPDTNRTQQDLIILIGGILASLYSLLQFAFAPLWGKLSDRYGRRPILLLTTLGLGLSYLLWFFSATFTLFLISRIFGGIMAGNLSVASAAMADMSDTKNRTGAMGLLGAAFGIGFIIGPVLGGLMALWDMTITFPDIGFLHPFSFCALGAALLALLSAARNYFFFKETRPPAAAIEAGNPTEPKWIQNPIAMLQRFKRSDFQIVVLVNLFYTILFSAFEFTLTFFYKLEFGLSPTQIGFIFFYIGITLAIGQGGIVRRMSGRIAEKKIALAGFSLIPLPLLLLGFSAPYVAISMLVLFPLTIGASFIQPALSSLASLILPEEKQGVGLGVFRSASSLARAIGPLAGAYLYWFTNIQVTYAILMAGFLILLLTAKKLPQTQKQT